MANKTGQHHYEHLLFGSVSEVDLNALLHRLRGLCDYATRGGIPFLDKEVGYKIEAGNAITRVKVRQSLDTPEAPWHLIYSGQLELGDRLAAVRTSIVTACSHNLTECLKELGFVMISELLLKGYLFKKDHMKIAVFKMYQPGESGDLEGATAIVVDRYLVELSAVTPSGQDQVENDMRIFAEQLKPTVQMERTDGVR